MILAVLFIFFFLDSRCFFLVFCLFVEDLVIPIPFFGLFDWIERIILFFVILFYFFVLFSKKLKKEHHLLLLLFVFALEET